MMGAIGNGNGGFTEIGETIPVGTTGNKGDALCMTGGVVGRFEDVGEVNGNNGAFVGFGSIVAAINDLDLHINIEQTNPLIDKI